MGNVLFVAIAALVIASVVSAGDLPASASRGLAIKVLAHNIAPLPNFMTVTPSTPCVSTTAASNTLFVTPRKPACVAQMTDVIDHARAAEGVKKLVLPSNWLRLSTIQQLFVITDIERVDRGFTPYLGMNASLNAVARTAAIQHLDPYPPQSFRIGRSAPGVEGFGSVWAVGPNVLAVDYAWLYSDGWGGTRAATSNIDCLSAMDRGCWGHRYELLGWDPPQGVGVGLRCATCEVGAGVGPNDAANFFGLYSSMAVLVALPAGHPPAMTFTWAQEKPYFNPATYQTTTTTSTTSTTTTTTTTTTTIPGATTTTTTTTVGSNSTTTVTLSPPSKVATKASHVRTGVASLAWATSPATSVSSVVFRVFAHAGCKGQVASATTHWKNVGPKRGTARVSRPAVLKVGSRYTGTLTAYNAAGWAVSRCVSLGRAT